MSTNTLTLVREWTEEPLKPRRERLWIEGGKVCHWCHNPTRLVNGDPWDQATNDHVIPRYKGGSNEPENIVSACRLCNNRRSHEDARGLPDGSLLGKYKVDSNGKIVKPKKNYVVLSGDEKKALMAKIERKPVVHASAEDVLREQRDQGLKKIADLQKELELWKTCAKDLESMSIASILRKRLAKWLLREN